jgi:hypothetical protein
VAVQRAVGPFVGFQQQRQMAGEQTLFAVADQRRQAAGAHLLVQGGEVVLAEGGGCVHGWLLS